MQSAEKLKNRSEYAYACRKRQELIEAFDSEISPKIRRFYDIEERQEFPNSLRKDSDYGIRREWFSTFESSLENCKSRREKIQLLTAAPIHTFSRNEILSKFPSVTRHMYV